MEVLRWNSDRLPSPFASCVHELVGRQVLLRPEAEAVSGWDTSFTYHQLDELSDSLASHLISLGVGLEDPVAFCFEKSAWTVVSMLAILKAGGVCLALDPSHPPRRLQITVQTARATLVLASEGRALRVAQEAIHHLPILAVGASFVNRLSSKQPETAAHIQPFNAAFLIYTSGSTGTPKGVVLEHSAVCTSTIAQGKVLQTGPNSRVFQFAAHVFDISIHDIFTTLIHGGCVCVPSEEQRTGDLAAAMASMRVTAACLTTTVASLLPADIPTLSTLILAGEAVTRRAIDLFAGSAVKIHNCYGPAESTIFCSWNGDVGRGQKPANIGQGLASRLWVVDIANHDRLAPIGCVGELLVEGPLLARGYLNDPVKTQQSFLNAPAWTKGQPYTGSRRMYATGDLVRHEADGSLEYIGRKDTQIKIHGQRLELSEIDHHLDSAIVVWPTSGPLREKLVAVMEVPLASTSMAGLFPLLSSQDRQLAEGRLDALLNRVTEELPRYMVPTVWLAVPNIPKNTSGKIDRAHVRRTVEKLEEEYISQMALGQAESHEEKTLGGEACTPVERLLASTFARVLNLPEDSVPRGRSLVSLGGDSITAMQVAARLRREGLMVRVEDLLRRRTISSLALLAQPRHEVSSVSATETVGEQFAMSPVQQLYFEMTEGQLMKMHQSFLLRPSRPLEASQVSQALDAIVRHHSMLRARFEHQGGHWKQTITLETEGSYHVVAAKASSRADAAPIIDATHQALDPQTGPLIAAALINLPSSQLLFLAAHHLVIDLVSWRVILHDLEELMLSGSLQADCPFSFQAWLRLQEEYAQQHLEPEETTTVAPVDLSEYWGLTSNVYGDLIQRSFVLDAQTTQQLLGDANRTLNSEPMELFLAAAIFSFTQAFVDKAAPTAFSEGHGRESWDEAAIDLSNTVGWFTTLAPVHVASDEIPNLVEAVRRVKDRRRSLGANGWKYFTSRYLNQNGRAAYQDHWPMELVFNYLGQYQQLERDDALLRQEHLTAAEYASNLADNLTRWAVLEVSVVIDQGRLRVDMMYNRHGKRQEQFEAWIRGYQHCLETAARELPRRAREPTLSDFPLLQISYSGIDRLLRSRLPALGLSGMEDIEAVYPCSSMQEGLLVSQSKNPDTYKIRFDFAVVPQAGSGMHAERLLEAWQSVIDRHPALRTLFVDSVAEQGVYDQIVLRHLVAPTTLNGIRSHSSKGAVRAMHHLTVTQAPNGHLQCSLDISHAIIDASSFRLILRDLIQACDGAVLAQGPSYGEYIAYLGKQSQEKAIRFWTEYLEGIEPCHFPHLGSATSKELEAVAVSLEDIPGAALQDFCSQNNATLANVFQVVWALVLGLYSGTDHVAFGYLVSGRDIPVQNVQDIVGPLINMLVCRLDLDREAPVASLINSAQEAYLHGLKHHYCSLASIQHALNLSGRPLFNTVMSIQRVDEHALAGQSVSIQDIDGYDPTEYDVTVNVQVPVDRSQRPSVSLGYWTSILSAQQAESVAHSFSRVLHQLVTKESPLAGEIDALGERDLVQIQEWNKAMPPPAIETIHELIQQQALAHPDRPAVEGCDGNLSYSTLDALATRLAAKLIELGVNVESKVALCFEKSVYAVVAMLAILKAGAAFASLDSSHPTERLKSIMDDLEAQVVLASPDLEQLARKLAPHVVVVSSSSPLLQEPCVGTILPTVSAANLAYVIFTSGTTGKPKGTMNEHGAYITNLRTYTERLQMNLSSRVLQFASYTFDASILEILTTLLVGGCVCVPNEETRLHSISRFIEEYQANWALLTPSFARTIDPASVPSLKTLVLGGEAMTDAHIATWSKSVALINAYGPSETAVIAAVNPTVTSASNIGKASGGLGWIVHPQSHSQLVPIGAVGELVIQGPSVARGYLKEPEKTATSFVLGPEWSSSSGSRVYKTGDLVRYTPDGSFAFIGRKDTQVKLQGQRMELGEVEHHLLQDDRVLHAAVLLHSPAESKGRLTAILTLRGLSSGKSAAHQLQVIPDAHRKEASTAVASISLAVAERVPRYMVPSDWMVIEAMPFSKSGKLDRSALARWLKSLDETEYRAALLTEEVGADAEPATEMDQVLRRLCARVLNCAEQEVLLNRSFVALGGDSIAAMQLSATCRADNIHLRVQDILQGMSLSQVAQAMRHEDTVATVAKQDSLNQTFDLSPIQGFFFELTAGKPSRFNQSFLLQLTRRIDSAALQNAIKVLAQEHSMLRARFKKTTSGGWTQYITEDLDKSCSVQVHHVPSLAEVQATVVEATKQLDIEQGPLFAALLFQTAEGDQFLYLVAHHLVIDLVSWRVILTALEQILPDGSEASIARQSTPFQAWARAQAEYVQHQDWDEASVLPYTIPAANPSYWGMTSQDNTYGNTVRETFTLDVPTSAMLLETANSPFRTEPSDIFITALLDSFEHVFTDRETPAVFGEAHGREPWSDGLDVSSTVGWFTTISPVSLAGTESPTEGFKQKLRTIKDRRRQLPKQGWQYFNWCYLTAKGRESRAAAALPMELVFNYMGRFQQLERPDALFRHCSRGFDEEMADVDPSLSRTALFDVSAVVDGGCLRFHFVYSRRVQHPERIQRWLKAFESTLCDCASALSEMEQAPTLSDYPLVQTSYGWLDAAVDRLGGFAAIEGLYPCAPIQQGILLSQETDPSSYQVQFIFEAKPPAGQFFSPASLVSAWEEVVNRHPMLRTVFVDKAGSFVQAVLKTAEANTDFLAIKGPAQLEDAVKSSQLARDPLRPPHQFTVIVTMTNQVFWKLTVSHAIMDAASIRLVLRDLAGAVDGRPLPHSQRHYGHYIEYLHANPATNALSYWTNYLSEVEPCCLRATFGTPRDQRRLGHVKVAIPSELTQRLARFSKAHAVTAANIFQTAWAVLLKHFGGSDDVCYGYLVSGRDIPLQGVDEIVGPLINLLIHRSQIPDSANIVDAAQRTQQDYLSSLAHQHCSLGEIQHALSLRGRPLFNTLLSTKPVNDAPSSIQETHFSSVSSYDPSDYDMAVNIQIAGQELIGVDLDYWTNVFSDWQARQMSGALLSILHHLAGSSATTTFGDLSLISPEELAQVEQWNETVPPPVERCIHDLVLERTQATPTKEAVYSFSGVRWTYAELEDLSTRLAGELQLLGLSRGTVVPLCFEKSELMILSMLAVLKAGYAFTPLDAKYPIDRLQAIVEDIEATIILSSVSRRPLCQAIVGNVVPVSTDRVKKMPLRQLTCPVSPRDLAYVIFTSGTTGRAKGTLIEHGSYATSATYHGKGLGFEPDSRVLQFATYTFDASVMEILTTLITGGTVCVPEQQTEGIAAFIAACRANWMFLTPSVASTLTPSEIPTIQTLVLGGEQIPQWHIETWAKRLRLILAYGPTETSAIATAHRATEASSSSCIGLPVGPLVWVVNPQDHHKLAIVGGVGELVIEGVTLARGYLKNPDKTEAAFIVDPAWSTTQSGSFARPRRMYKTGDLVRYQPDGSMEFLGRKDTQVKLHGQRLELAEIEHHLSASEPVQNAMAFLPDNGPCKGGLTAVLSLNADRGQPASGGLNLVRHASKDGASALFAATEAYLAAKVPPYMVPSFWLVVDRLPLSNSGKLDRAQITRWVHHLDEHEYRQWIGGAVEAVALPQTAVERVIQAAVADVLNLSLGDVSMNRSFPSLGGDSITSMQLASRCRANGVVLRVRDIMKSNSLTELSPKTAETVEEAPKQEQQAHEAFALSPIQSLFFNVTNNQPSRLNQSVFLRLSRTIRHEELTMALNAILRNHAMLRARFSQGADGVWQQYISAANDGSIAFQHYDRVTSDQMVAAVNKSQLSLDITKGPVFRCDLFTTTSGEQLLFLVAHHLVIDLVSWRIVLQELEELLQSPTSSTSLVNSASFQDWLRLQAEYISANATSLLPKCLAFDVPAHPDPFAYWNMANQPNVYADHDSESFQLPAGVTSLLLSDQVHRVFRTQVTDLLLGSLLWSFTQTFTDRKPPRRLHGGPWPRALER
ncbi:hypothetical protein N7533_011623 [Penicillium manginii]|uniref:uncharacterized protein n=1 Tax=Penicillium manginii TaxID=203109 RepID=UPI0025481A13|nr:uncharacterized protein N7533_011623 [Penicillium manginii]KAJ5742214.1 hypothetical protein N7533_011623 [Penicillium manginii]